LKHCVVNKKEFFTQTMVHTSLACLKRQSPS
jgi:hypothetical protein